MIRRFENDLEDSLFHQLEVDNVFLKFGARRILSSVYLKLETGKISGFLGRNGTGKSSLMNVIFGTLKPESCSVRFNGDRVASAHQVPELIRYLPQYNFIPAGLRLSRVFDDFNLDYAAFANTFTELKSKEDLRFNQLSGGQKRLTELYLVLRSRCRFAMLDEPFSHLSPVMVEQVKELILEEKQNKGILISDHMYRHIIDMSDDLYLLAEEKVHLIKDLEEIEKLGYTSRNR